MKNSIARKMVLFVFCILLIFSLIIIFIVNNFNQNAARDNAENLLGVFETQMIDGRYNENDDYKILVKYYTAKNIRVTVIDLSGVVLADTDYENTSVMGNHLNRKEVKEALESETGDGIGSDIRKSDTLNIKFLYVAKKVTVESKTVVLRIAVPLNSINSYVYATLGAMAGVLLITVIISVVLSGLFAKTMLKPYNLIKIKLNQVLAPNTQPETISLTKYDDVNSTLTEIDDIGEKLNSTLSAFHSEKQKLDFIIENINQGVIALNAEKEIVLCNKTAKSFLRIQIEGSSPIYKMIRDKTALKYIIDAIESGNPATFDSEESDGKMLNYKLFPIVSQHISLIIVMQDVTDIRKLAIEKQAFFENAGHELKTPLSSILGYSEMLLNKEEYNKVFIETINKEALRMKDLISDMLSISELEEKVQIVDEAIDLREIISQVILSYTPKAESKNITVSKELESCRLYANKEKITEVAANLIDNAIKYTDKGGHIIITLKTEKDKAIFSVSDNGIGIAPKDTKRIFERFYRVDKGRSRAEGSTGLGLAIVKHICNQYNAPITVKSKLGQGTTITIIFAT